MTLNRVPEGFVNGLTELKAETAKYITRYASYKNGSDWSPAIDQAFSEIQALGGGTIRFPKGTYNISRPLPVTPYITYEGDGYLYSIINYTSSDTNNIMTINVKNVTIKNLNIQGNVNQVGHGIEISGTVPSPIGEIRLDNILVSNCGKSGIHIGSNVWMLLINNIRCNSNYENGFYDQSTDNTFDGIHAEGNKMHGIYLGGSNNRYSNIKSIFNSSSGTAYAGIYISGGRLQISNIEAQDNRYDGIVFDGCVESIVSGAVSDASGNAYIIGTAGTITARAFVFKNNCKHIKAGLYATSYLTQVAQLRGLDIDSSCSWMDITYDQGENKFSNDYAVNSSLAVSVTTPNTLMVDKFMGSGKILNNLMSDALLTSTTSAFAAWIGTATRTYSGGVATITYDTFATKRVDLKTSALTQGHLYYFSVKVSSDVANALSSSIYKDAATVPAFNNISLKTFNGVGSGTYITVEFLIYMFDADTSYHLTVGTSTNNAVVLIKEPMCIDITADMGVVCNPTNSNVFDPKFMSQLIANKGGFFATTKTL